MKELGTVIDDDVLCFALIESLPDSYRTLTSVATLKEELRFADIVRMVREYGDHRQDNDNEDVLTSYTRGLQFSLRTVCRTTRDIYHI